MVALFRLSLVLVLLASGVSLGAARGQVRAAGQVVLCAGEAVQVQLVDARGQPVTRTHICPDMALSLMAAVAQPLPDTGARRGGVWLLDPAPVTVSAFAVPVAGARARGPPFPV